MKWAFYHDFDELKCETIREAIKAGAITDGEVVCGDIRQLAADDVRGFRRVHFFAGGGFWDLALNWAGWGDEPVWTGSCPCQPFSSAGKRKGKEDERHLWPAWIKLIRQCKPPVIFGEQVGAAAGGKTYSTEVMQILRNREAVRRVLYELERTAPRFMQVMHPGSGETPEDGPQGRELSESCPVETGAAGTCAGECGAVPREDEGAAMHSGRREHSGAHRSWDLRGHRDTVRSDQTAVVGLAFTGQNLYGRGLYDGEHEGSDLFLECDGERLGYPEGRGCGERDFRTAIYAERRTARLLERGFEETPEWSWRDSVQADLERAGYAFGSPVFGAHSAGAPHIRQRLYFCADDQSVGRGEGWAESARQQGRPDASGDGFSGSRPDTAGSGYDGRRAGEAGNGITQAERCGGEFEPERLCDAGSRSNADGGESCDGGVQRSGQLGLLAQDRGTGVRADTDGEQDDAADEGRLHAEPLRDGPAGLGDQPLGAGLERQFGDVREFRGPGWLDPHTARSVAEAGATRGWWGDCDWWYGRDGKYRPAGPGVQPLAHGSPARVGRLRMYGDGIVVPQAAEWIKAYREVRGH